MGRWQQQVLHSVSEHSGQMHADAVTCVAWWACVRMPAGKANQRITALSGLARNAMNKSLMHLLWAARLEVLYHSQCLPGCTDPAAQQGCYAHGSAHKT
jgi:hypothetical protein